jgi:hypothetical protein
MRPLPVRGGCWPEPLQELLLKAVILEGDPAREAYALWRSRADLGQPDAGTFRLLPLLGQTLKRLRIDDGALPMLAGTHRMAWCKNQVLFRRVSEVLSALADAGVPTMVLKGIPLAIVYFGDPGAWPMDDGDVLVPPRTPSGRWGACSRPDGLPR